MFIHEISLRFTLKFLLVISFVILLLNFEKDHLQWDSNDVFETHNSLSTPHLLVWYVPHVMITVKVISNWDGVNSRGSTLQKFFTWAFNNYVIDKKTKKKLNKYFFVFEVEGRFSGLFMS